MIVSSEAMRIQCNACGEGFDVAKGSLAVDCPKCGARITLTALETKPQPIGALAPREDGIAPESLLESVIGGYRLRTILGGGGMGIVYEAVKVEDGSLGPEIAAVKVLSSAFAKDPEFVERFRREADALTTLRHKNLIEVYAKGEWKSDPASTEPPLYYFVMERFFGEDLRSVMARGPVAPETAAAIVSRAAEGLAYAHEHGIVHRDVKPANILVKGDPAKDGEVKVVDFGVAQLAAGQYTLTSLTRSHLVLGTINYMSPEQRVDASKIDHRADVYALGVVAYELLTGRLPIGAFEAPSEVFRTLTRAADRAVLSALRRDPDHRPKSALAFANELERALVRRSRGARRWAISASIAAALSIGAAGAYEARGLLGLGSRPEARSQRVDAVRAQAAGALKELEQEVAPQPAQAEAQATDARAEPYAPAPAVVDLARRMREARDFAMKTSRAAPPPKPSPKREKSKKPASKKEELELSKGLSGK
jgi:DNA-directed RNA polymerase subunit RPC12/RpoP